MKYVFLISSFILLLTACAADNRTSSAQGNEQQVVWTAGADVEAFWAEYVASKGGLTWGKSSAYPEYKKVNEGDTLWIELEEGPCLMEFFHNRWRRANDVWRWSDTMNAYGGCPNVFK